MSSCVADLCQTLVFRTNMRKHGALQKCLVDELVVLSNGGLQERLTWKL